MPAAESLAHHSFGLTPLPMNRNASRRGTAAVGSAPHTVSDSSHGSAITTPVPRRKRRRDHSRAFRCRGLVITLIWDTSGNWRRASREELTAGDDIPHQVTELVVAVREVAAHF